MLRYCNGRCTFPAYSFNKSNGNTTWISILNTPVSLPALTGLSAGGIWWQPQRQSGFCVNWVQLGRGKSWIFFLFPRLFPKLCGLNGALSYSKRKLNYLTPPRPLETAKSALVTRWADIPTLEFVCENMEKWILFISFWCYGFVHARGKRVLLFANCLTADWLIENDVLYAGKNENDFYKLCWRPEGT